MASATDYGSPALKDQAIQNSLDSHPDEDAGENPPWWMLPTADQESKKGLYTKFRPTASLKTGW